MGPPDPPTGLCSSVVTADGPRPTGVAAFFDLEGTILARSSGRALSRASSRAGAVNQRAALKSGYAQLVASLSSADDEQVDRLRDRLTALCTGWDVAQVTAVVEETLHDVVDPLVYAEASARVAEHRERGEDVVVVSASGTEVVQAVGRMLGATHCLGSRMVTVGGRYTGEVEFTCVGAAKAVAVRELADRQGYDLAKCSAYGDSIGDLPLLEAVGHPTAVNPDRKLRREAAQRDWPVVAFEAPVSLRRLSAPSGGQVAAAAVGLGAVAAGAAWYGLRRRRAD